MEEKVTKYSLIQEKFKRWHAFLSLPCLLQVQFRTELTSWKYLLTVTSMHYRCQLCNKKQLGKDIERHLIGKKHRIRTESIVEMYHPKYLSDKSCTEVFISVDGVSIQYSQEIANDNFSDTHSSGISSESCTTENTTCLEVYSNVDCPKSQVSPSSSPDNNLFKLVYTELDVEQLLDIRFKKELLGWRYMLTKHKGTYVCNMCGCLKLNDTTEVKTHIRDVVHSENLRDIATLYHPIFNPFSEDCLEDAKIQKNSIVDTDTQGDSSDKLQVAPKRDIKKFKLEYPSMNIDDLLEIQTSDDCINWRYMIKRNANEFFCILCGRRTFEEKADVLLHLKESMHLGKVHYLSGMYHPVEFPHKPTLGLTLEQYKQAYVNLSIVDLLTVQFKFRENRWNCMLEHDKEGGYICNLCGKLSLQWIDDVFRHIKCMEHCNLVKHIYTMRPFLYDSLDKDIILSQTPQLNKAEIWIKQEKYIIKLRNVEADTLKQLTNDEFRLVFVDLSFQDLMKVEYRVNSNVWKYIVTNNGNDFICNICDIPPLPDVLAVRNHVFRNSHFKIMESILGLNDTSNIICVETLPNRRMMLKTNSPNGSNEIVSWRSKQPISAIGAIEEKKSANKSETSEESYNGSENMPNECNNKPEKNVKISLETNVEDTNIIEEEKSPSKNYQTSEESCRLGSENMLAELNNESQQNAKNSPKTKEEENTQAIEESKKPSETSDESCKLGSENNHDECKNESLQNAIDALETKAEDTNAIEEKKSSSKISETSEKSCKVVLENTPGEINNVSQPGAKESLIANGEDAHATEQEKSETPEESCKLGSESNHDECKNESEQNAINALETKAEDTNAIEGKKSPSETPEKSCKSGSENTPSEINNVSQQNAKKSLITNGEDAHVTEEKQSETPEELCKLDSANIPTELNNESQHNVENSSQTKVKDTHVIAETKSPSKKSETSEEPCKFGSKNVSNEGNNKPQQNVNPLETKSEDTNTIEENKSRSKQSETPDESCNLGSESISTQCKNESQENTKNSAKTNEDDTHAIEEIKSPSIKSETSEESCKLGSENISAESNNSSQQHVKNAVETKDEDTSAIDDKKLSSKQSEIPEESCKLGSENIPAEFNIESQQNIIKSLKTKGEDTQAIQEKKSPSKKSEILEESHKLGTENIPTECNNKSQQNAIKPNKKKTNLQVTENQPKSPLKKSKISEESCELDSENNPTECKNESQQNPKNSLEAKVEDANAVEENKSPSKKSETSEESIKLDSEKISTECNNESQQNTTKSSQQNSEDTHTIEEKKLPSKKSETSEESFKLDSEILSTECNNESQQNTTNSPETKDEDTHESKLPGVLCTSTPTDNGLLLVPEVQVKSSEKQSPENVNQFKVIVSPSKLDAKDNEKKCPLDEFKQSYLKLYMKDVVDIEYQLNSTGWIHMIWQKKDAYFCNLCSLALGKSAFGVDSHLRGARHSKQVKLISNMYHPVHFPDSKSKETFVNDSPINNNISLSQNNTMVVSDKIEDNKIVLNKGETPIASEEIEKDTEASAKLSLNQKNESVAVNIKDKKSNQKTSLDQFKQSYLKLYMKDLVDIQYQLISNEWIYMVRQKNDAYFCNLCSLALRTSAFGVDLHFRGARHSNKVKFISNMYHPVHFPDSKSEESFVNDFPNSNKIPLSPNETKTETAQLSPNKQNELVAMQPIEKYYSYEEFRRECSNWGIDDLLKIQYSNDFKDWKSMFTCDNSQYFCVICKTEGMTIYLNFLRHIQSDKHLKTLDKTIGIYHPICKIIQRGYSFNEFLQKYPHWSIEDLLQIQYSNELNIWNDMFTYREKNYYCLLCKTDEIAKEAHMREHFCGGKHLANFKSVLGIHHPIYCTALKMPEKSSESCSQQPLNKVDAPLNKIDAPAASELCRGSFDFAEFLQNYSNWDIDELLKIQYSHALDKMQYLFKYENKLYLCLLCKTGLMPSIKSLNQHISGRLHSIMMKKVEGLYHPMYSIGKKVPAYSCEIPSQPSLKNIIEPVKEHSFKNSYSFKEFLRECSNLEIKELLKIKYSLGSQEWEYLIISKNDQYSCLLCKTGVISGIKNVKQHVRGIKHMRMIENVVELYHPMFSIEKEKSAKPPASKLRSMKSNSVITNSFKRIHKKNYTFETFLQVYFTLSPDDLLKIKYSLDAQKWNFLILFKNECYFCLLCKTACISSIWHLRQHFQGQPHLKMIKQIVGIYHPSYCIASETMDNEEYDLKTFKKSYLELEIDDLLDIQYQINSDEWQYMIKENNEKYICTLCDTGNNGMSISTLEEHLQASRHSKKLMLITKMFHPTHYPAHHSDVLSSRSSVTKYDGERIMATQRENYSIASDTHTSSQGNSLNAPQGQMKQDVSNLEKFKVEYINLEIDDLLKIRYQYFHSDIWHYMIQEQVVRYVCNVCWKMSFSAENITSHLHSYLHKTNLEFITSIHHPISFPSKRCSINRERELNPKLLLQVFKINYVDLDLPDLLMIEVQDPVTKKWHFMIEETVKYVCNLCWQVTVADEKGVAAHIRCNLHQDNIKSIGTMHHPVYLPDKEQNERTIRQLQGENFKQKEMIPNATESIQSKLMNGILNFEKSHSENKLPIEELKGISKAASVVDGVLKLVDEHESRCPKTGCVVECIVNHLKTMDCMIYNDQSLEDNHNQNPSGVHIDNNSNGINPPPLIRCKIEKLLTILRHLSAIEKILGVLGQLVTDLITKILIIKRTSPSPDGSMLLPEENILFLETTREKLRGLIEMDMLDVKERNAASTVADEILKFLNSPNAN